MSPVLRLGTRASQLATRQSRWVADRVSAQTGREVQLVPVVTTGDVLTGSLASLGGTGVFATELRQALVAGECDFVVHSLKDLPTAAYPGLVIAAIPERERASDALCSANGERLGELPPGARVGTGSPRRAAQVRRRRPDLDVDEIRGNVDTRLRKVAEGEYAAVVLAAAGLRRIGREDAISEEFDLAAWPTSAGQGALAVECRESDLPLRATLLDLTQAEAQMTSELEREVLRQLEAGCSAPVGISARADGPSVTIIVEAYVGHEVSVFRSCRSAELAEIASSAQRTRLARLVVADLADAGLNIETMRAVTP